MTHFETLLVESIRDLAKQVQENNVLCARLDERSEATERRLLALEAVAARAVPPPPSAPRSRRVTAKQAGISAGAVIALATAILTALGSGNAPATKAPQTPPAVAAGAP